MTTSTANNDVTNDENNDENNNENTNGHSEKKTLAPYHLHSIRPYKPGKPIKEVERELGLTNVLKLASNENPLGPSPLAAKAAAKAALSSHIYPDATAHYLRAALSKHLGLDSSTNNSTGFIFGAGSNEIISLLVQTFCIPTKHNVVAHKYAFLSYRLAAQAHNVAFVETCVHSDTLACNVTAMLQAVTADTRIVFLANPNNPTGAYLSSIELSRLLQGLPASCIVVIDEAYHGYAAQTKDYPQWRTYIKKHPNIVILRTFSKLYGLAGMRVGYGIGPTDLLQWIERIRRPFNVNAIAQAAATAALLDTQYVARSVESTESGLQQLAQTFHQLGCRPYPSKTNFILVDVSKHNARMQTGMQQDAYHRLLHRGVIVRPMEGWGLAGHIRVSLPAPEQLQRTCDILSEVFC